MVLDVNELPGMGLCRNRSPQVNHESRKHCWSLKRLLTALKHFSGGDSSGECIDGSVPGSQPPMCDNEQGTDRKKSLKEMEKEESIKFIFFLRGLFLKSMHVE